MIPVKVRFVQIKQSESERISVEEQVEMFKTQRRVYEKALRMFAMPPGKIPERTLFILNDHLEFLRCGPYHTWTVRNKEEIDESYWIKIANMYPIMKCDFKRYCETLLKIIRFINNIEKNP